MLACFAWELLASFAAGKAKTEKRAEGVGAGPASEQRVLGRAVHRGRLPDGTPPTSSPLQDLLYVACLHWRGREGTDKGTDA